MEAIRISVMVSIYFFQQGNDTHTVLLHIIDNIELKFDCKVKIANQIAISVKKTLLDIFRTSDSPSKHKTKLKTFSTSILVSSLSLLKGEAIDWWLF